MRAVLLPEAVRAAIRSEARDAYPHEACGFLLGRLPAEGGAATVRTLRPAANARSAADRRRRYLIDPDAYRAVERESDAEGLDVVGFWHSHPDAPARPSEYDLEHAWPTVAYVIVTVSEGEPGELAAWRLADDRSGFTRLDMLIRHPIEPS